MSQDNGAFISPTAVVAADATCLPGSWIGPEVEIAGGATISPGAVIGLAGPGCPEGKTVIGPRAWIGPGAYVEPGAVIDEDAYVGSSCLIRHGVHLEARAHVGARCTIMDHARIREDANLIAEVYVCEYADMGAHCQISPGATLVNDRYPPTALEVLGPVVGECAILGVKAVIWPGVKIGYHAMVASLSEVKDDVGDYVLVRGTPAKPICDVRQIRMKHRDQWIYPYPWMRLGMPNEDITKPAYEPRKPGHDEK